MRRAESSLFTLPPRLCRHWPGPRQPQPWGPGPTGCRTVTARTTQPGWVVRRGVLLRHRWPRLTEVESDWALGNFSPQVV
jgi:hypothetical protein